MEYQTEYHSFLLTLYQIFFSMVKGNMFSHSLYIFCNGIDMLQLIYAFLRPLQLGLNYGKAIDYYGYVMVFI
jgi:hypothetical protein